MVFHHKCAAAVVTDSSVVMSILSLAKTSSRLRCFTPDKLTQSHNVLKIEIVTS